MIGQASETMLFVDTHVHLYSDDADTMLSAAARAVAAHAGALEAGAGVLPCLMLTETARDQVFDELAERDEGGKPWVRTAPAQGAGLWLQHTTLGRLLLIAGGQTVTSEGVEVLSLGTRTRFEDGEPIDATIGAVVDDGALAVLPYGLGKWVGGRGKVVADAFTKWHDKGVRLGDNGGRPRPLGDPALFTQSTRLGHKVLPGSDPLRTGRGKSAAGSYGVVVDAALDPDDPAESVTQALRGLPTSAAVFGGRVGLTGCVKDQLALRLNKQLGR